MKKLIVGGCSFTFEDWCWPTHLANSLEVELVNLGMGSQGNDLIKKTIIAQVEEELKAHQPQDLLVGIMWTGVDRWSYRSDNTQADTNWGYTTIANKINNPRSIVSGTNTHWFFMNSHWDNIQSTLYYKNFHSHIGSMIETLEDVMFTQLYLKSKNIKYFMTTYMDIFGNKTNIDLKNNLETAYLYDNIDFSKFLPIKGCYEYIVDNYPEGMPKDGGDHPIESGYNFFTKKVILPFLTSNQYKN